MRSIKIITANTILVFLLCHTAHAQDYTNAQLGLPDLNQVAPIVRSATDAPPFAGFDNKSKDNTFADTLSYLFSIANTGFKCVEKNILDKHYLQASNIYDPDFQSSDRVVTLRFQYDAISFKKSVAAQNANEQVADFARKLAATDSSLYRIGQSKNKTGAAFTLWFGKVPVLSWYIDLEKHGVPYPIFQIAIRSAPFNQLADETSYKGKFPTEVLNQDGPQIWEIRGMGKTSDSYQRFNGIFKDGYLISGSKTFHGYGKFYDGTWMSDEWLRPVDYGRFNVTFTPERSNDTITGYFWHGSMGEFEMNEVYSHYTAGSPGWVRDTYIPYKTNFDALRKQRKDRIDAQPSTGYGQNNTNSNSTTNSSSGTGRASYSSFSKCSVCNGKGYTEYDCGQGGGHPCRKYCTSCNGTGQVHN
ncbi:MAG: hypothetical protein ABI091_00365 [Ferruginibacter sp.]